jgi:hypothetical protein
MEQIADKLVEEKDEGLELQPLGKKQRNTLEKTGSKRVDEKREFLLRNVVDEIVKKKLESSTGKLEKAVLSKALEAYNSSSDCYPNFTIAQLTYRVQQQYEQQKVAAVAEKICHSTEMDEDDDSPLTTVGQGVVDLVGGVGGSGLSPIVVHNDKEKEEEIRDEKWEEKRRIERQKKIGGRPKREDKKRAEVSAADNKKKKLDAENGIVAAYFQEGNVRGQRELITQYEKLYGLEEGTIRETTISMRLKRAREVGCIKPVFKPGPTGSIEGVIEGALCEYLSQMALFGFPLTTKGAIALANDLIADTPIEVETKKKKVAEVNDSKSDAALGQKWLTGFLNRYKNELKSKYPHFYDKDRAAWTNKQNFQMMYDRYAKALVMGKLVVSLGTVQFNSCLSRIFTNICFVKFISFSRLQPTRRTFLPTAIIAHQARNHL